MSVKECKEYLGDGVYASFDGYMITLTAENGVEATDTIYIDANVYEAFARFLLKIKEL